MVSKNKLSVIKNQFQGTRQKVLCICSGGVLRSPTAAEILSREPFNFNTRSCGSESYALIPLTEELVLWADEVVVMDKFHAQAFYDMFKQAVCGADATAPYVHILNIEDEYDFRDPVLVKILTEAFEKVF